MQRLSGGLLLAALLLSIILTASAQPTYCNYNNCGACRADDKCGWCAATGTCAAGTAAGATTGRCSGGSCWVFTGGSQCPDTCASKKTCAGCSVTKGCGWCGATGACMAAGDSAPCSGNCATNDEAGCWKSGSPKECPSVTDCSQAKNCTTCTNVGCAWCPASGICFEATEAGNICPAQPLAACNGDDCIRLEPAQCPKGNCSALSNCRDCASAGCDWCGLTARCMEGSSDPTNKAPCGPFAWCSNAAVADCYKSDPEQCPDVPKCENLGDCKSCTTNGCFWCGKSRMCMEASNATAARPCRQGTTYQCGTYTAGDCWKGQPQECPNELCETISDCATCTNAKCYWCGKTAKCIEASAEPVPRPCQTEASLGCQNDFEAQCWKGSPSLCPTRRCDQIFDCKTCAAAKCSWCGSAGASGKCMETTDANTPAPCGLNWDSCNKLSADDCWKNNPSSCPQMNCVAINNCTQCTDAGCSWCADTQKCKESTVGATPTKTCAAGGAGCQSATCWKLEENTCPMYKNGSTLFCDAFDGSCTQCVQNGCGYCSLTKKCMEVALDGHSQCEGATQSATICPPAKWNVGSCDAECALRDSTNTCSCLSTPGCGLCAGTLQTSPETGEAILVTKCIAIDSKNKPASSTTCMKLYTDKATCPNCFHNTKGDCTTCTRSHDCGWCPGACVYGDSEQAFQQDICPEEGQYRGDVDDAVGCKVCPRVNNQECNAPHGTCNRTTSTCDCVGSYTGAQCDVVCNPGCNHGHCELIGSAPKCVCDPGWSTSASDPNNTCSVHCSTDACSSHGSCNSEGKCTCDPNYFRRDCAKYCNAATTCSGNGDCDEDGDCKCDAGSSGPQCTCSPVTCLNGGKCRQNGQCECASGYFGPKCDVKCDAAKNCNGRGVCSADGCKCETGWTGSTCSMRVCPAAENCAECGTNSDCGWCESLNACIEKATGGNICSYSSDCTASISMLSYKTCTDGVHCNCVACETFDRWRSLLATSDGKAVGNVSCTKTEYSCFATQTTPPSTSETLDSASKFLIGLIFVAIIVGGVAGFFLWRRYKEYRPLQNGVQMDEMESELKLLGEDIAHEELSTPANVPGPEKGEEEEKGEVEITPSAPTKEGEADEKVDL